MKFIYSYTTHQNERREGLTISAPNRDAAYSELNKRGIRPYKLYPAPGLWNKISAIGGRGLAIIVLALALGLSVAIALTQHKDIVQLEQNDDVREIVTGAITSKVRRQLIGDQGFIEKGIRTGWSDVFEHEGERFLASFAIPGEVREQILAVLLEGLEAARSAERERRASVLQDVLTANKPGSELERRRKELKQIIKDTGSFVDARTIAALEKIGFKCVSSNKHWKLDYANVRIPISKTPSDRRAAMNTATDIANRCF